MSIFHKKGQLPRQERDLYPVLYVAGSLKEYQRALVEKEVDSLRELGDLAETYLVTQLERGFSTLDFYKSLLET